MGEVRFSLRIPPGLHKDTAGVVKAKKEEDPGASLNAWILAAMREKIQRDGAVDPTPEG